MKIALVIPPSLFLMDERVFPSLGVLKVAAALESADHRVSVVDLSGRSVEEFSVPDAQVIGITATMPQMPAAFQIAERCRESSARLILGGPHPTLVQASARRGSLRAKRMMTELLDTFDTVVCGDGELAAHLALTEYGLIDADDLNSALFLSANELASAPHPSRHLIDIASYRYAIDGVTTQSLIAQLGCPFGCNFCGGRRSPFLRKVRVRPTASVLAEMQHLYDTYRTRGFMFLDDELNVNRQFPELLQGIIELQESLGVEFRLRGLLKSELVTKTMAAQMYRAGFRQVLIGFESGSPRMLENMNKHATLEENTRTVDILREAGIKVKALMSIGHPGESSETCEDTRRWLLQVQPDDFDVTIITVYPGTPYFDDVEPLDETSYVYAAANGDRLYMQDVDHRRDVNFYKGIPKNYRSFVWTDALTREQMAEQRDFIEEDVRARLSIPWPSQPAEVQYEHSMGCR